ncbi:MAG: hypothetical protein ACLTBV_14805 [Enterocloster bolteae]
MAALRFFDGPAAFHCGREAAAGRPFIAKRSVQRNMQEAIFRQDAGEAFRLIDSWFEEMAGLRSYDQIQAIRRGVVETWVFISGYSIPEGRICLNMMKYTHRRFLGSRDAGRFKRMF